MPCGGFFFGKLALFKYINSTKMQNLLISSFCQRLSHCWKEDFRLWMRIRRMLWNSWWQSQNWILLTVTFQKCREAGITVWGSNRSSSKRTKALSSQAGYLCSYFSKGLSCTIGPVTRNNHIFTNFFPYYHTWSTPDHEYKKLFSLNFLKINSSVQFDMQIPCKFFPLWKPKQIFLKCKKNLVLFFIFCYWLHKTLLHKL